MDPQNGGDWIGGRWRYETYPNNAFLFGQNPQKCLKVTIPLLLVCCLIPKIGKFMNDPRFSPGTFVQKRQKDSWQLLTSRIHSSLISIGHSQTSQKYVGSQKPGPQKTLKYPSQKPISLIRALGLFVGESHAIGQRPKRQLVEALRSSLHLRSLQRWCRSWQSCQVSSGRQNKAR